MRGTLEHSHGPVPSPLEGVRGVLVGGLWLDAEAPKGMEPYIGDFAFEDDEESVYCDGSQALWFFTKEGLTAVPFSLVQALRYGD